MASVQGCLQKFREDRIAREKARLDKLRELNLKKYSKDVQPPKSANKSDLQKSSNESVKNNFNTNKARPSTTVNNGVNKKPMNFSLNNKQLTKSVLQKEPSLNKDKSNVVNKNNEKQNSKNDNTNTGIKKHGNGNSMKKASASETKIPTKLDRQPLAPSRKSMAVGAPKTNGPTALRRKTMQLQKPSETGNTNPNRESVFERLYKPKQAPKPVFNEVEKVKTDPNYLKKVIKDSNIIFNHRRRTVHESKVVVPVRRSISAVHFKRISKNELPNCIHKWSSVGEKLDMEHLAEANEDDNVKEEKVISAIKSERKRVKFQTPLPYNFNTPKPEELQARLKTWLQKRGKNLDSYHHLQCFGLHHFSEKEFKIPPPQPQFDYDDENKENIALESDSDDDSYCEIMNMKKENHTNGKTDNAMDQWRSASCVSESVDLNETNETTMSTEGPHHHVDELLLGALNDLTELLREGFEWEQCARWLRALHARCPAAPRAAAYWECRAALEERRGDLPASVHCWEEAIANGTERSVVESNLDQLLDKFMQLKISPNSGNNKKADPKMVDVKNVFKSTIIRFAVQQAKIRNSSQSEAKFTVTPVRRSNRLSGKRTPLRLCSSVQQATRHPHTTFYTNPHLAATP